MRLKEGEEGAAIELLDALEVGDVDIVIVTVFVDGVED